MNPKVSIIVPIYKVEPYIHRCMESILAQSFKDFELILIDDGSPDNCGEICDEYANVDKRIRVIHKENGGLSSARNAGIMCAQGEYLLFIDSDDYVHEKMVETLYKFASLKSADITLCDFVKVQEKQSPNVSYVDPKIFSKQYNKIEALEQLFIGGPSDYMTSAGNNVKWIVAWNKLIKRELFENLRFKENRVYEDEFIIHELLFKSNLVVYIPSQLYYYVQRPSSIINSSYNIKKIDKVYALKERVDFFREKNLHVLFNKALIAYKDTFFWNYYEAKGNLVGCSYDLKLLKKEFDKTLIPLLRSNGIRWKQKLAILMFTIHPLLHEVLKKGK